MSRLRKIYYKFLRNPVHLTSNMFTHEAIQDKLEELGENENPAFLIADEKELNKPISEIPNFSAFKQLFKNFQEFIKLKSPKPIK